MIVVKNNFGSEFWTNKLKELDYPLELIEMDIPTLKEQKVIHSDLLPSRVLKLTSDDFIEVALLEFNEQFRLTRSKCTKTTRSWKANRLIKPLLIFTNGTESFVVIVPGKGVGGEAKILGISEKLYHTDHEVLESIRYPGAADTLNEYYDTVFFPYEKVRKEFFEGYRDLYQKVEKAVREDLMEQSSAYAQRFIGRLMFLYFLQRKGWLKGDRQFRDSIEDYKELNILFYESLNREGTPGIPFLNGSLFEREIYLDSNMENKLYPVMDQIFREARIFLNKYNFTVDEASPLEVEVSIDPALIGTVFENMLPEYERGSKGTFYTPRNEISFICRRALVNWLGLKDEVKESINGKEEFHDGLVEYVKKLRENKSEKEVRELKKKLLSMKVLDPAVGSGGFILGMMQEIIQLIHETEETVGWKTDPEELKNEILPNLYGFDIEAEAIEIASLRLWLSLIIDQKDPEPLPNLDMNLVEIKDSLVMPSMKQISLDKITEVYTLRENFNEVKTKYMNEHYEKNKIRLKEDLRRISIEIKGKTGIDPDIIESYMHTLADVIIMNPPYIEQLSIPIDKKNYYAEKYGLDKKSDIYAYFIARALNLLSDGGIVSVISSDKWLETGYGISLQEKLKRHIIAVYGQKERTFGADINTVITIYGKENQTRPAQFTYIETYGKTVIRRNIVIDRKELKPGKWFYLRAPKIFTEKILPKLTHKLSNFADIKRGFTTGANDFFYMTDISHLYEMDYLTSPQRFEDLDVEARTQEELENKGLIYIKNEIGERFIIDRKDTAQVIRSPSDIDLYHIERSKTLVFKPNPPQSPGKYSFEYIKWGEKHSIKIRSGGEKGKKVEGYHRLVTVKNHRPNWFNISDLKPSLLLHPIGTDKRHFVTICSPPYLADQMLVMFDPKGNINENTLWTYLNSTVSYIVFELYGRRFGAGALQVPTGIVKSIPVPNLSNFIYDKGISDTLLRKVLLYDQELKNEKRRKLDIYILETMGFEEPEEFIEKLYESYVEVVNDRIVKGKSSMKNK